MKKIYVIAEASQGYEGSIEISKLLIRSAKKAGADAIKFQVVYANDLAEQGYQYYDLFKSLEMPVTAWQEVRNYARAQEIDFVIDIFGAESFALAQKIDPEGIKIHSTSFFDDQLIGDILSVPRTVYLSIGGIHLDEIQHLISRYNLTERENFSILYGYQAEPTPINANNLLRIPKLRVETGVQSIGFMDHSDGGCSYSTSLSVLALGLGVAIFEKHITLDRYLEMEDYTSALGVTEFAAYVKHLHEIYDALGTDDIQLTDQEIAYRERAIKRVVASRDLEAGEILSVDNVKMNRPKVQSGYFKFTDVIGKVTKARVLKGEAIDQEKIV